jgi:hypothetical protein
MNELSALESETKTGVEKFYGKYPGLVLENTAPDGEAHLGELLVEVPGILEETPDGSGERPIQVQAKPCFLPGFFFIPEAGAQVWVEFVAGDLNQPLWTGVWYPTKAVPKTADGENPNEFQKVIRTASGHVILLDDSGEAEKLIITDKVHGNTITMDAGGIKIEGSTVIVVADEAVQINSASVSLGENARDPAVKGTELNTLWTVVMNHTHGTAMGPSGPPVPLIQPLGNALSQTVWVE